MLEGASAERPAPSWFRINIHKLANEHRQAKDEHPRPGRRDERRHAARRDHRDVRRRESRAAA